MADNSDYRRIFINDLPLMDVRAPVEFAKGAFPTSINLPLLDDQQRAAIGTEYRQHGQEAAISLGWDLLTPALKTQRQQQWLEFIQAHPEGYLYCFRGGLRSKITQQLIAEAGFHYPRVFGGYKAMRRFLIESLEQLGATTEMILVSGRTCSGKTRVLAQLATQIANSTLDLEATAHHRGSAFGSYLHEQPNQINFENALAIALLKHNHHRARPVFVEDEGKLIGRLALPDHLRQAMKQAPRVVVHTRLSDRIDIALQEYVIENLATLQQRWGEEEGMQQFFDYLLNNLARIKKRLGGLRHAELLTMFESAIDSLQAGGNVEGFIPAIQTLLVEYYDPMYDYQSGLDKGGIVFEGSADEVVQWAREQHTDGAKATLTMAGG